MKALSLGLALLLALVAPVPAAGQARLQQQVEQQLAAAGPGTRFGLVVAAEDGTELIAIAPDARFIPASITKMFTTAAAYTTLTGLDQPDTDGGAAVRLERNGGRHPDVVLEGNGDARLSSAADCRDNCLATLADAVAARTRRVRHVIGDDRRFADERWGPGMSWEDIPTRFGTAASALTLDDNELVVRVTPAGAGTAPRIDFLPFFEIYNRAVTVPSGETALAFARLPGSRRGTLSGTIAAAAAPEVLRLGIDDPAEYAAWRLRALLEARGVRVSGAVMARHRAPGAGAPAPATAPLARLVPPPLAQDIARINKAGQNLHAELLLRRIGLARGDGSIAGGLAAVNEMAERAGIARHGRDFFDGSGMSTYNRLSPRAAVALLRWISSQPWGAAWRSTLPVAGVDGTLTNRFRGTPLAGRLFAKTGTLNSTNALSGYMIARSGRTLIFSIIANDVPTGTLALPAIDAALVLIAESH